jgi:molybdopterin-guanine dinucleotide biosynthesis protein A
MTTTPSDGFDSGPDRFHLYILAGGGSRRYGSDKARAVVDGEPLISGVARVLGPMAKTITVVAGRDGLYEDLGFRTIGDLVPGVGPLAGLLTAADDRPGDGWLILTACDWSGIRAEWIGLLADRIEADSQAVVFRHEHLEPALALYHTSVKSTARRLIGAGRFEMTALIEAVRTVYVPVPDTWGDAKNINRPEDGHKPPEAT